MSETEFLNTTVLREKDTKNINAIKHYVKILEIRSFILLIFLFMNNITSRIFYDPRSPIEIKRIIPKFSNLTPIRLSFLVYNPYVSPIGKSFDSNSFNELLLDFQIRFKIIDNQMEDYMKKNNSIDSYLEDVLADLELIFSFLYNLKLKHERPSQFTGPNVFTYAKTGSSSIKLHFVGQKEYVSVNFLTLKEDVQNMLDAIEEYSDHIFKGIHLYQGFNISHHFNLRSYQNILSAQQNKIKTAVNRVKYNLIELFLSVKPYFNELNMFANVRNTRKNILTEFDWDAHLYLKCGAIVKMEEVWNHLLSFEGYEICGRKLIDKVDIRSGLDIH